MLGDSGSNALGALLGLSSVDRFTGRGGGSRSERWRASTSSASFTLGRQAGRADAGRSATVEPARAAAVTPPGHKYVFVTGGVVSSLGKGITAASLGRLLKARGLKVDVQKFDPYLNVDPGTMSPFQHGEVFVTEDGAETDLDIGHYERFLDQNLSRSANHTAGGDLGPRPAPRAQGRLPRQDRPGDPAHHRRDQGADPPLRRAVATATS